MSSTQTLGIRSLLGPISALLLVGAMQVAAAVVYVRSLGEPPIVQFAASQPRPPDSILYEGYSGEPQAYSIVLNIRPAPRDAVVVGLKYEGDAELGSDIEGPSEVRFDSETSSQSIELKVLGDNVTEKLERLTVVLAEQGRVKIGSRSSLTYSIGDPEPLEPPQALRFSSTTPVQEDNSAQLHLKVELKQPAPIDRTFDILISGTARHLVDHDLGERIQVTVKKGRTEGVQLFSIRPDEEIEGDELIVAHLADDAQLRSELKIVDDDGIAVDVRVRFEVAKVAEGGQASLIAELVNPERRVKEDLVIDLESVGGAKAGSGQDADGDFFFKPGTQLTISTSGKPARLDLPVFADKLYEGEEFLKISCSSRQLVAFPDGQVASAAIVDMDPRPEIVFDKPSLQVRESDGTVTVAVMLKGAASSVPIDFDFRATAAADGPSATENEDYEFAAGRASIPPTARSLSLSLKLIDDDQREPHPPRGGPADEHYEQFQIELAQEGKKVASLPIKISDDDFWQGDLLLLVPVTQELVSEPQRMKEELEKLLNGVDPQAIAGGTPWLVFPKVPGIQAWPAVANEKGQVELDVATLGEVPPFLTRGTEGHLELKRALVEAANAADKLRAGAKQGKPVLAVALLDAKAGISQIKVFELDEVESKDSNMLVILQAGSPSDRALGRLTSESRTTLFGQGAVSIGQDSSLPLVRGALNDFRKALPTNDDQGSSP